MLSNIAGILLILLGLAPAYFGIREIARPDQLTTVAAYSTAGIGIILLLVGLLHFRAPHKAFLFSVPVLLYFNVQMYFDSIFYFEKVLWPFQAGLLVVSILILVLSYRGYKAKQVTA